MENSTPPMMGSDAAPPPPTAAPPPAPPPPPPVQPFYPLYPAPRNPQPPRRGRGWMVLALVLAVLLGISVLMNLSHAVFGRVVSVGSKHRAGGNFEEVVLEDHSSKSKVAVIDVQGVISSSAVDGEMGMVKSIKEQLSLAADDDSVKAVILKVDSPGGEVLASDEIYKAIQDFQKHSSKPVIASMGSLAASGGYYVSTPCRWIVANELTITGSIGVIMETYNYRGLMNKVGVQPMVFKSGKFKDMLSGEKSPEDVTPEERNMVQSMIDETFGRFKEVVAEGRTAANRENKGSGKALIDGWRDLADGRILSGKQAFENGFVDELGNFDTAVERAKTIAGLKDDPTLVVYVRPFNIGNLLHIFGKTDVSRIKIDLGLDGPKVQSGKLYFLSPTLFR